MSIEKKRNEIEFKKKREDSHEIKTNGIFFLNYNQNPWNSISYYFDVTVMSLKKKKKNFLFFFEEKKNFL